MTMKYWRVKLKGERSVDEVQAAVGRTMGYKGHIVRIYCGVGETNVYVAAEKSEAAKVMKQTATLEETVTLEEVSLAEATKLS